MVSRWWSRIASDESGVTAVEYALMLTLIIVACIASIQALGGANQAFWASNIASIKEAISTD